MVELYIEQGPPCTRIDAALPLLPVSARHDATTWGTVIPSKHQPARAARTFKMSRDTQEFNVAREKGPTDALDVAYKRGSPRWQSAVRYAGDRRLEGMNGEFCDDHTVFLPYQHAAQPKRAMGAGPRLVMPEGCADRPVAFQQGRTWHFGAQQSERESSARNARLDVWSWRMHLSAGWAVVCGRAGIPRSVSSRLHVPGLF
jgi:hypothetical protein